MDLKDVYELLDKFDGSACCEMELNLNGMQLNLKKYSSIAVPSGLNNASGLNNVVAGNTQTVVSGNIQAGLQGAGTQIQAEQGAVTQTQAEQVTDNESAGDAVEIKAPLVEIKAPLVGTFYQAPGPDEQPYVKVGQQVKKGDVVGIIEAMKLMNEVVAPQDGVILSIDATDGNMVQYGQVLFTMK